MRLEFGEFGCVVAREVEEPDKAELGDGKTEAGAVEPMTDRGDYDRHEEQIEEPETMQAFAAADRPKGGTDNDQIENAFRGDRKQPAQIDASLSKDKPQQERGHDCNADRVADQQR